MIVLDNVAIGYWLTDWCKEANLKPSKVQYKVDKEKSFLHIYLNIYTPNPGYLIGRKGWLYEKYKALLIAVETKYKCEQHLEINLVETTQADFWVDYDYMEEGF